jgi:hypothetical protein
MRKALSALKVGCSQCLLPVYPSLHPVQNSQGCSGCLKLRVFGAEAVSDGLLRHDRMAWIGRSDEADKASLTYGGGALLLIAVESNGRSRREFTTTAHGLARWESIKPDKF